MTVPTAAEKQQRYTDFSDLIGATGTFTRTDLLGRSFEDGQIFDPATTRAITGGQADPVTGIAATVRLRSRPFCEQSDSCHPAGSQCHQVDATLSCAYNAGRV